MLNDVFLFVTFTQAYTDTAFYIPSLWEKCYKTILYPKLLEILFVDPKHLQHNLPVPETNSDGTCSLYNDFVAQASLLDIYICPILCLAHADANCIFQSPVYLQVVT